MKKEFLFCYTSIILLTACGESKHASNSSFNELNKTGTNQVAIIPADSAGIYLPTDTSWFTKASTPTHLSETELAAVDEILKTCIDSNYKFSKKTDSRKWLSGYKRQYVPFMNERGEKLVWINCFAFSFNNWKSEIIHPDMMMDGGEWIFNVTINLSTKKFNRLQKINNGYG